MGRYFDDIFYQKIYIGINSAYKLSFHSRATLGYLKIKTILSLY